MSLERLKIQNVRNIIDAELIFHPRFNLIVGENGSGKTSLLESIQFLEKARQCRGTRFAPFVNRSFDFCIVFGLLQQHNRSTRLGVHRSLDGKRVIRINGEIERRSSTLARELPVLYLGPETIDLLLGAPTNRRRFLNWGVFHVEPQFGVLWLEANRSLKQRNSILRKSSTESNELDVWTKLLAKQAEQIDKCRAEYHKRLAPEFTKIVSSLSGLQGAKLEYSRGWNKDAALIDCYQDQIANDLRRGFTQLGFQRSELKVTAKGEPVTTTCSRGELKILSWALVLAQGKLLEKENRSQALYLVDDMASELDLAHRTKICAWLEKSGSQIIATSLDADLLRESWQGSRGKEFHVEHGRFTVKEYID